MEFIKIVEEEDIEQLANLASEIWHEYWTVILSSQQIDYMVEKFQSETAIKSQIKNEKYIYHILKDNENIIGYFGVSYKNDYLFLSKLYIKKDFRGLGFGKIAFNEVKNIARKYNKQSIQLTVNKYNINTIEAYKKWGFKTIDDVVTDIGNGFVMDDYIMQFEL